MHPLVRDTRRSIPFERSNTPSTVMGVVGAAIDGAPVGVLGCGPAGDGVLCKVKMDGPVGVVGCASVGASTLSSAA